MSPASRRAQHVYPTLTATACTCVQEHWGRDACGGRNEPRDRRDNSRRRMDPVMREAGKRGLDVDALHASHTPAWGNLRTRGAGRKTRPNYAEYPAGDEDEDEMDDEPAASEEEGSGQQSGSESEDEGNDDLEEEEEGARRRSRRVRQQVQRYSPPPAEFYARPRSSGGARSGRYADGGSSSEDEGRRGRRGDGVADEVLRHTEAFTQRYSARERRRVDHFDPEKYAAGGAVHTGGSDRSRKRRRERCSGGGSDSSDEGASSGEEGREGRGNDEAGEGDGGEAGERRQYSFRDRSLVTINPHLNLASSQQQASQPGSLQRQPSLGGRDHKRPRGADGRRAGCGSRLRRAGSRRAAEFELEDELPDLPSPDAWRAVAPGPVATGVGPLAPYAGASAAAGGNGGHANPQPWELALRAEGLGRGGTGPAGALGPGAGKGNAEITPLQVSSLPTLLLCCCA